MPDPRIALFQRKGAAPPPTPPAMGAGAPMIPPAPEGEPMADEPMMVACPECGCEFDPMAPPPVDEAPPAAVVADEEGV